MATEQEISVQINHFIKQLSVVINSFKMYPPGHTIITNSMDKLNTFLKELIKDRDEITIGLADEGRLIVSGTSLQMTPFLQEFSKQLSDREIKSLTLLKEISMEELSTFVDCFNLSPGDIKEKGGVQKILEEEGITNAKADLVVYQEIGAGGKVTYNAADIQGASDLKLREMAKSFDLPYKGKSDEVKRQLLEFLNLKDKEALSSLPTPQDVEQADIKQLVTYCKELGISHRGKLSMVKARLLKTISEEAMTHVQAKQPEAQPAAAKAAEKQDEDQVTIHKDDLKMFQDLIAKQAKMEIDQVKLYNVAVKDEMTGLYNHRYLKQRLEQEIKNSDLFDAPVSFILSDVDHFKNFNDTYGHQEGDRVLKTVARLMQEAAENDICCRYGGEEFCVICPGKTSKQTMDVAEKIRAGVAGEPFEIEGKRVQITISLGVSSFPVDSSERDDLIKKADQAMYYAKEHGRDQAADYSALQHDDLDAASKAQEEHDLKVLDEQISEVNALQGDVEEKTLEDYTRDLASDDLSLKKKAILGLAKYDSPQVRELLELLVSDVNEEIRFFSTHVINALKGEIPLGQRPPELAAALGTEAPPVEAAPTPPAPVEQALPEAPPVEAAPAPPAPVEQALPEAPPVEAAPAPIEHVAPAGPPPKSVEEFLQDLASADTGVKIEALRWLPSFDDIQVPGMVEMAMFDPDPTVAEAAKYALDVLKGVVQPGTTPPAAATGPQPQAAPEPEPVQAPPPPPVQAPPTEIPDEYQGLSLDELTQKLDGTDSTQRAAILQAISLLDNPRSVEVLEMAMFDPELEVQRAAALGLRRLGRDVEVPGEAGPEKKTAQEASPPAAASERDSHMQLLETGTLDQKKAAIDFFITTQDPELEDILEMATFDPDQSLRDHAKQKLDEVKLTPPADVEGAAESLTIEQCQKWLTTGDLAGRRKAAYGLTQLPLTIAGQLPMDILGLLENAVFDLDRIVRRIAETAIYRLSHGQTITEPIDELIKQFESEVILATAEEEIVEEVEAPEAEEIVEPEEPAEKTPVPAKKKKRKQVKTPKEVKPLVEYQKDLESGNPFKKKEAIIGMSQYDDPRIKDYLELALFDESEAVRQLAEEVMDEYKVRASLFSDDGQISCPECNTKILESNYWCPECTNQLKEPVEEEEEFFEDEEVPPEELPELKDMCTIHDDQNANYVCDDCGQAFCVHCGRLIAGRFHCETCLLDRRKKPKFKFTRRNIQILGAVASVLLLCAAGAYWWWINTPGYLYDKGQSLFEQKALKKARLTLEKADRKSKRKHAPTRSLLIKTYYQLSKEGSDLTRKRDLLLKALEMGGGATELPVRDDLRDVYIKQAKGVPDSESDLKNSLLEKARQLADADQVDEILLMMKEVADKSGRYKNILSLISDYYKQKHSKKLRDLLMKTYFDAADGADTVIDKFQLLNAATEIDPDNEEAKRRLALTKVQQATDTKEATASISLLEQALQIDPSCQEAKETLVEVIMSEAGKTDVLSMQEHLYMKALEILPDNEQVKEGLADVNLRQAATLENVKEKIQLIQKTIDLVPTANAYYQLALALGEEKDYRGQINTLRKALEIDPDHHESKNALAETYFNLGVNTDIPDEKIKWYDMALMYNPEKVGALHNLGLVFQNKGLNDEAITKFEKAIDIDPNFSPSYLNLGWLYWRKKGDLKNAEKNFRVYCLIDPDSSTSKKVKRYIKKIVHDQKLKGMIKHKDN